MVKKILIILLLFSLLGGVSAGAYFIYKNGVPSSLNISSLNKFANFDKFDPSAVNLNGNKTFYINPEGKPIEKVIKKPVSVQISYGREQCGEGILPGGCYRDDLPKFDFKLTMPKWTMPKWPIKQKENKTTEKAPAKSIEKAPSPDIENTEKKENFKFAFKNSFENFFKSHKRKAKPVLTIWTIQLKAPAGHFMDENIEAFKKLHPGVKIVWVDIPIAEAQKRTLAAVLSGNPPDLINLNPDFSSLLAQKGILEYFTEDETKDFHPELIDKLKYNNKIFALPFYATSPVTVFNEQILNKCFEHGYPVITSYEDVYSISSEIKNCTDKPSIVMNLNENDTFSKILNKYDISNFEDEDETKALNHVVYMFDDMYKKGYLPKDTLTLNHREVIEQYMAKNAVFVVAGSNFIKMIKENAPDVYKTSEITSQLTSPDGKYDVGLMNFVIPKNAKNKALAKEFAFRLLNKENQLKFTKLTNTLPANLEVLLDDYFIDCPDDIVEKSRCVGASQLNYLVQRDFGYKNKKAINDTLNKALEEILLNNKISDDALEGKLNKLQDEIKALKKD